MFALGLALFLYMIGSITYGVTVMGKRYSKHDANTHERKWGRRSIIITLAAFGLHAVYFILRWISAGHIPNSNMFEYLVLLAGLITIAFLILFAIYRTPVLGMFALPVTVVILIYASVYPWQTSPLIPQLQSNLLIIHVTTAALGEAFFAIGFAAGFIHLVRTVNYAGTGKTERREQRGLELVFWVILVFIGFVLMHFLFKGLGYQAEFNYPTEERGEVITKNVTYSMPPIVGPHQYEKVSMDTFLGTSEPWVEAPGWLKGINSASKLNTIIWSLLSGTALYWLVRLILRRKIGAAVQPATKDLDPELLDEISYRSIAIGFPIFTLGALIFAMIWAQIAWSRFWGWDPKEVWALITWLFYSYYLHIRLSKGWIGKPSSWLAVVGFIIVMFTLIGVNLLIAGLHAYAGV
ncbi:c-type cytochrome biogenesis protein CcsB [Xylanibacillus composti]|nr:c-type cytochrome biogenesis protein CcsB [Xylanibacillus composti]